MVFGDGEWSNIVRYNLLQEYLRHGATAGYYFIDHPIIWIFALEVVVST